MADEILKEATKLGSSLAALASSQLKTMLDELRGPSGAGTDVPSADGANLGGLAASLLQLVNQTGSLLVQLSQYDVVRKDANLLRLDAANPISNLTIKANERVNYDLLLENNGRSPRVVTLKPSITIDSSVSELREAELVVQSGERRRVTIELPPLSEGKVTLSVVALAGENSIARKTVAINVMPQPRQHDT
jgi:hypothetical protein